MTRLLLAELNRLRSRWFTIIALLVVVALLGVFQLAVNSALSPPTAAEVATNRAQFEESRRDWQQNHEEWEQECLDAGESPENCEIPAPTEGDFGLAAEPFAAVAGVSLLITVYLTAMTMFLIAASFVGAEYSSGSIANWLTFVPRRGAVFASKLVVIALCALVLAAVTAYGVLACAAGLTRLYGGSLDGLAGLAGQAARGLSAAVILAVLGFCIGLVGRHTAAALGVLLGYFFVEFVRSVVLSQSGWAQQLTPWTPEGNLVAIVDNGHRYFVPTTRMTSTGLQEDYLERTISLTHGITYWVVVLALVVVGSLLIFRRRDVT